MLKILKGKLPIKIDSDITVYYINNEHKEDLYEIYRNENVWKYVARKAHTSIMDTEEFIEIINARIKEGNNLYLGIYDVHCEKLIGIIRFLRKEDPDTLTIGYALNESFWGKGIVPKVLNKLIKLIDSEGEYKKLRATVRPENINSQRCLEKLGFKLEGKFIKSEVIDEEEIKSERFLYIRKANSN